jgi:hypothetical protein
MSKVIAMKTIIMRKMIMNNNDIDNENDSNDNGSDCQSQDDFDYSEGCESESMDCIDDRGFDESDYNG